jgi:hypothetical protein
LPNAYGFGPVGNVATEATPAYSAFRCGEQGFAYNEAAFKHFLGLERRRAHRSRRLLLLVLVKSRIRGRSRADLDPGSAALAFKAVGACVREVDFIGWYREGKVIGAVAPLSAGAAPDVARRLQARVDRMLKVEMGPEQVAGLRVRVVRLGGKVRY